jgi:hypothetical protein
MTFISRRNTRNSGADDLESVECVHVGIQRARSHPAIQGDSKTGTILGDEVLAVILARCGGGARAAACPRRCGWLPEPPKTLGNAFRTLRILFLSNVTNADRKRLRSSHRLLPSERNCRQGLRLQQTLRLPTDSWSQRLPRNFQMQVLFHFAIPRFVNPQLRSSIRGPEVFVIETATTRYC